jgi:putative PIN family toxin of toxin-antitoxin system
MPRVVLDSSALISAFLTPQGTSGQVLDAAERGVFVLCLSAEILAETAGKLLRKTKLQTRYVYAPENVEAFCDGLAAIAELVTDLPELHAVPNDPKDNPIVATAVAAGAGYLVTGDRRHLLALGSYQDIRIVSPRALLDLV